MNFWRNPRNKYNAKRVTIDGINFDSKSESEYYRMLKLDPEVIHVDCHVPVTLPGGLRLNVDFFVWRKTDKEETGKVEAIEIKGKPDGAFSRMRQLFDECHPLGPMQVYRKTGSKLESL